MLIFKVHWRFRDQGQEILRFDSAQARELIKIDLSDLLQDYILPQV
jgi:hypothetical protein